MTQAPFQDILSQRLVQKSQVRSPRCAKSPATARIVAIQTGQMQRPDWLAGEAVLVGPVSVANSLLTGNFTGNFAYLGNVSSVESPKVCVVRGSSAQIPYATEQGSFPIEQGILTQEQGFSSIKTQIIAR
jgi:hypothetical protein